MTHTYQDITEQCTLSSQFPLRLIQSGFHLFQRKDDLGGSPVRFVLPPVVTVSQGPFLLGSEQQLDARSRQSERPQHIITLNAFHIAQYPVTVTEYTCFIEATGYQAPLKGYMITWQEQISSRSDYPVVCITWYDAQAYVYWLADVTNTAWRLPTEAEWEKAARGTDKRIYPWGDMWDETRTSYYTGETGPTEAIGLYPSGASPYGVMNMVGNALEWVNTLYKPYPYSFQDQREDNKVEGNRIWRGSIATAHPETGRLSRRQECNPSAIDSALSFRLAY